MRIIERSLERLYGLPCWGLNWDSQVGLSMSFGQPHLRIRDPKESRSKSVLVRQIMSYRQVTVRGRYWLWIQCAFWRLSLRDYGPATGGSSDRRIKKALAWLDGQQLKRAFLHPETCATRFVFDLGATLDVRRFSRDEPGDLWTLYKPGGHALSVRGDGRYSNGRSYRWKSIPRDV